MALETYHVVPGVTSYYCQVYVSSLRSTTLLMWPTS